MGSNRDVSLCTHASRIIICLMKSASGSGYPQASDSKIPKEHFPGLKNSQISLYWLHIALTMTMKRRKLPTKDRKQFIYLKLLFSESKPHSGLPSFCKICVIY